MQSAGKIRHVGLSEVSTSEIERARKVCNREYQNRYTQRSEVGKRIDYAKKKICFLPWFPVGGGRA